MAKPTVSKKVDGKSLSKGGSVPKAATLKKKTSERKLSAGKLTVSKGTKAKRVSRGLELPAPLLLQMHDLMVKSRILEERLIKVYRAGDSYFWIGGPGEEAFGVPLGLLAHKGQGVEYDFLHLHYRSTPTMVALGMSMEDSLRLMMNRVTDPCTGGRNFCNHYCFPQWNVVPVSSPIEVQYGMAIGTAISQRRHRERQGSKGITIVSGGDAGTAEGDFASSLIWASRPGFELPMLITVQNNKWGISTHYDTQHGEQNIAHRGLAFGIRTVVVNGNDPIEVYRSLQTEMDYIRQTGKPVLAEFMVSRLYGHSSADGANRANVDCPIEHFEKKLVDHKLISAEECKAIWKRYEEESRAAADLIRQEPVPHPDSIWNHVYVNSENADWRKF
jgi:2-oxoisovalerate dehydrogenase E1 component alpha subunit